MRSWHDRPHNRQIHSGHHAPGRCRMCDRLEASLTATADTRRRLLDALLAEALAAAGALKAAE